MTGRLPLFLLFSALLALYLTGCASKPAEPGTYKVFGKTYKPLTKADGFYERGIASWYGKDFHGKKTSNGETYDMYGRTCAHKTLPLGSRVRITNLDNNRETVARVNDRGPFVDGRVVDLTLTLAKELGMAEKGITNVLLEALDGVNFEEGLFTWQVGSFSDRQNALRLAEALRQRIAEVRVVEAQVANRTVHRVQVGKYTTKTRAMEERRFAEGIIEKPWLVGYD